MASVARLPLAISLAILGCAASPGGDGDETSESGSGSSGSGPTTTVASSDPSTTATTTTTTTASTTTTSDPDTGDSSTGTDVPDGVPIFVAQGMVGRTTISCDDGLTWVGNRSWDLEGDPHLCGTNEPVECFAEGAVCSQMWFDGTCSMEACDCGHSPGFSKGVEYGAGVFVATWGWGWPGAVATSTNGIDWTTTLDGDTFGGLRYGGDKFVVASRTPQTSADGLVWTPSEEADFVGGDGATLWSVRRFGYSDWADGGRFVAYASGDSSIDTLVSSDGGASWWRPSSLPADCLGEGPGAYGDIIGNGEVILMVDGDGHSCRSTDGGDTWTSSIITGPDQRIASSGVWTGEEFWFWGWGNRYRSTDGATWTTEAIASEADVGPVARSDDGTLVAVNNVWLGYDEQVFLRSTDGLEWDTLDAGAYTPGHPIFFITRGYAEPSEVCPGI